MIKIDKDESESAVNISDDFKVRPFMQSDDQESIAKFAPAN